MNSGPSFKISIPVTSIYVLCLFLPTIDILAVYSTTFFNFPFHFEIAALIFPAIFPIADSITEVYGKKVSYYLITAAYITIITFSLLNNLLLSLSDNHILYAFLLKPSLVLTLIGPIGYIITSYINIKFLSKLKLIMRGKHFVIRSLACSGVSDILLSLIILPLIFYQKNFEYISGIYVGTVLIKILVTIPYVFIARILVFLFRYIDKLNNEAYNPNFLLNNLSYFET